jgi:hypothetical protein
MPTRSEDRCMRRTLEPETSSGISRAGNSVIRVPSIVERRLGSVWPRTFLVCHKTGTLPQIRLCRAGTEI